MPHEIIAEAYEAAVLPHLWLRTLDKLAEVAGAEGTVLFAADPVVNRCLYSERIEFLMTRWVEQGWSGERNERGHRLIPIREPRFLTDLDAFTPEEMERSPYYSQWLRPMGFWWCAGTAIHSPTGDTVVLSIERLEKNGPVEPEAVRRLDALRPHLARAMMLSARASLERARAATIALESIGLPAAVIAKSGRVVAANALFATCSPMLRIGPRDQLHIRGRSVMDEAWLASGADKSTSGSIALPGGDEGTPAVAHIVPLIGDARDVFTGAASLVYVTVLASRPSLPTAVIEALFDLSPAEARVTALIASGCSVSDAGQQLGVSTETIRAHLKSTYAKTGVNRQLDLARLLVMRP